MKQQSGNMSNRWRPALLPVILSAAGFAAACPPRTTTVQGVRIICSEPTASVFVDGRFAGLLRQFRGRVLYLKKGTHLIEVRKRGYFTRYRKVRIRTGSVEKLRIRLYRELE